MYCLYLLAGDILFPDSLWNHQNTVKLSFTHNGSSFLCINHHWVIVRVFQRQPSVPSHWNECQRVWKVSVMLYPPTRHSFPEPPSQHRSTHSWLDRPNSRQYPLPSSPHSLLFTTHSVSKTWQGARPCLRGEWNEEAAVLAASPGRCEKSPVMFPVTMKGNRTGHTHLLSKC